MYKVYCKLPSAGLGNQLFPMLKAALFANKNNMELRFCNYHQFHLGGYLRREKTKRNYHNYFIFQKSILSDLLLRLELLIKKKHAEFEPEVRKKEILRSAVFGSIPWPNYFEYLNDNREETKASNTKICPS